MSEVPCSVCTGKCCRNLDSGYRVSHMAAQIFMHECESCDNGVMMVSAPHWAKWESMVKYYVIVDTTPRKAKEPHYVTFSSGVSTNLQHARAFASYGEAEKVMDSLSLMGEDQYRIASVHKDERVQIDLL